MSHCVQQYIVDKNYAWNSRERERDNWNVLYRTLKYSNIIEVSFFVPSRFKRMHRISLNII